MQLTTTRKKIKDALISSLDLMSFFYFGLKFFVAKVNTKRFFESLKHLKTCKKVKDAVSTLNNVIIKSKVNLEWFP